MALTTPLLRQIPSAINASQAYDFLFEIYGGNQCVGSNLIIQKNSDNLEVYNQTIDGFQFKHSINANILKQNTQYKAKLRTKDINNNWSEFSQWIVFWCFSPATISIPSISTGTVNNQNALMKGTYEQPNDPTSVLFI